MVLKRATMAAVTALATVNVWTGCPLVALWVGSRAVGTHDLSMAAVVVVLIVLALLEAGMLLLLAWLSNVYDGLIGLQRGESELTWIRRLCAPPEAVRSRRAMQLTSVEGVVVINVYVAVSALTGWYVYSLL
jgi:hypothetical protein